MLLHVAVNAPHLALLAVEVHTCLATLTPCGNNVEPLAHWRLRQSIAPAATDGGGYTPSPAEAVVVEGDGAAPAVVGVLRHSPAEAGADALWKQGPERVRHLRHVVPVSVDSDTSPLASRVKEKGWVALAVLRVAICTKIMAV